MEGVEIFINNRKVSYESLLEHFDIKLDETYKRGKKDGYQDCLKSVKEALDKKVQKDINKL